MFLQKVSSFTPHQRLKNPKATKSLFSPQGKDGSQAFDQEIVLQWSEGLSPFPEGILYKCTSNCFRQSVLRRMRILEGYKRARMPEHLSISSNCTDWFNKRLLDLSIQSCLYSRGNTSDTLMIPSKLHAFPNSSLRQRLTVCRPEGKGGKKTSHYTTKVQRVQTTKVQVRLIQIKW